MVQSTIDHFRAGMHKNLEEFLIWQNAVYDKIGLQFPNRKSGRITGEELVDTIDIHGSWKKFDISLPERNHIKVGGTETEYKNGFLDYYIEVSCAPAVSVNKGKNNKPISIHALRKLIERIHRDYCIDVKELELHSVEQTLNLISDNELVERFKSNRERLLLFQGKVLRPIFNDETNVFMGYKCSLTHFYFKFYLVDVKYGEKLNCFRIERRYKRMATFKRSTGINTLADITDLTKVKRCMMITLKDWDDVIVADPTIKPTRKLLSKEAKLIQYGCDVDFWLKAKGERDKDTYKDWVNTYRNLSYEFGDGMHIKLRNLIVAQVNEVEREIEREKLKNSPNVTSRMTGNNGGNIEIDEELINKEQEMEVIIKKKINQLKSGNHEPCSIRTIIRKLKNRNYVMKAA